MHYCTLIRSVFCFVLLAPCYLTLFSAFRYAIFIHSCIVFQYYSVLFSSPLLPPPGLSNSPMITNMFYVYAYMIIYVFMYTFVF
jgi:hypothetical protein